MLQIEFELLSSRTSLRNVELEISEGLLFSHPQGERSGLFFLFDYVEFAIDQTGSISDVSGSIGDSDLWMLSEKPLNFEFPVAASNVKVRNFELLTPGVAYPVGPQFERIVNYVDQKKLVCGDIEMGTCVRLFDNFWISISTNDIHAFALDVGQ
jgi:hypothetical protein